MVSVSNGVEVLGGKSSSDITWWPKRIITSDCHQRAGIEEMAEGA